MVQIQLGQLGEARQLLRHLHAPQAYLGQHHASVGAGVATLEPSMRRASARWLLLRSRLLSSLSLDTQGLTVSIAQSRKLREVSPVILHSDSCTCT